MQWQEGQQGRVGKPNNKPVRRPVSRREKRTGLNRTPATGKANRGSVCCYMAARPRKRIAFSPQTNCLSALPTAARSSNLPGKQNPVQTVHPSRRVNKGERETMPGSTNVRYVLGRLVEIKPRGTEGAPRATTGTTKRGARKPPCRPTNYAELNEPNTPRNAQPPRVICRCWR